MKCPIDSTDLVMADRQGIEIDYCPKCRGVWLDRGELDKIVERSAAAEAPTSRPEPERRARDDDDRERGRFRRDDDDDDDDRRRAGLGGRDDGRRRRRGGFLEDIFGGFD